jgi:hypothetical protein
MLHEAQHFQLCTSLYGDTQAVSASMLYSTCAFSRRRKLATAPRSMRERLRSRPPPRFLRGDLRARAAPLRPACPGLGAVGAPLARARPVRLPLPRS